MNRREINQAVKMLNFESLLVEDKERGESSITREDHPEDCFCDGDAEGWDAATMGDDQMGCMEAGRWVLRYSDGGYVWRCSACLLEELGAKQQLKVIGGEVTIDRP